MLVEDNAEFVGRVRAILRDASIPNRFIEKHFAVNDEFKIGKEVLGLSPGTQALIAALYADDYALIHSDAAQATAPPEPATEAPPQNAPERFCVTMESTAGSFQIEAIRRWSPHGVQV